MSGHSKWSTIKHKKAASDAKKGQVFSKLSKLITIAAKKGGDPEGNLSLKHAINQAKVVNMPLDKIDRAIKKGNGELQGEKLEEVRYEAFGPGGSAIIIEGITDNNNRTFNEIKHLLNQHNTKLGEQGSALWAFEKSENDEWKAKIPLEISEKEKDQLKNIIEALEDHDDIQKVYTNTI